jgi:hypothetical protein
MTSKKARPIKVILPTTKEIVEHLSAQDEVLDKLTSRLEHAHVLNGGFDSMMEKVNKIESTQVELKTAVKAVQDCQDAQGKKLTEVHTAIYDPDKGLYSKVKGAIEWINKANWIIKGTLGVLGAGALTGMGKLLYDIFTGHIHYTP